MASPAPSQAPLVHWGAPAARQMSFSLVFVLGLGNFCLQQAVVEFQRILVEFCRFVEDFAAFIRGLMWSFLCGSSVLFERGSRN